MPEACRGVSILITLWLSLVGPSIFVVQKYCGWTGVAAYAVVAALALWRMPGLPRSLSVQQLRRLAVATFVLVAVLFAAVYPIANTHEGSTGSDDDDAYNLGAVALAAGHSPYGQVTYLGNVLHQFPGAFVLAAPFVLLGSSALQNLFWLPLFFVAVAVGTRKRHAALQLAWVVLVLSPTVVHQVVTGTGYLSNTIYVLLGLWWLVRTEHRDAAAVGWGIALASRANFLFLVPLAFGALHQRAGWKVASRATALAVLTCACLTIPFLLEHPMNFGPLEAADRLLRFDVLVPHLGIAVMGLMALLAVGLALTPMDDDAALFRNCAVVQAFPVVTALLISAWADGGPYLSYMTYGTFSVWFALAALIVNPDRREPLFLAAP